jgi:hypothetical protein
MAEVDYMHVCDFAFGGEGGKHCIIGIFSVIHAQTFPATHPYMAIAVGFNGTPHERLAARIELGRPNGDVLVGMDGQIAMNADGAAHLNANFVGLAFPEPGRYTIKVSSGGRTLTTQSLRLLRMPAAGATPPATPVH